MEIFEYHPSCTITYGHQTPHWYASDASPSTIRININQTSYVSM